MILRIRNIAGKRIRKETEINHKGIFDVPGRDIGFRVYLRMNLEIRGKIPGVN